MSDPDTKIVCICCHHTNALKFAYTHLKDAILRATTFVKEQHSGSESSDVSNGEGETDVDEEMEDLLTLIHNIIGDHEKISKFSSDPALMIDVYYDISCEMIANPDLRLTWLENMAAKLKSVCTFLSVAYSPDRTLRRSSADKNPFCFARRRIYGTTG